MFPSETDFDTKVTLESEMSPLPEEPPFRILILGDWSGRESRNIDFNLENIKPVEIDRDNFDETINRLNVGLELEFSSAETNSLSLVFAELEDFHPDRIFQKLPLFANLRELRRQLKNPETFNVAAHEVRSWFSQPEQPEKSGSKNSSDAQTESNPSSGQLLDQILGQQLGGQTTENASQNAGSSELGAFIKKIVKPHIIHTDAVEQSELLMIVDEVISDLMRKILHHPQFQALESIWRGLYLLVRRLETDSRLKIYLADVCKTDLASNLKQVNSLADSIFCKLVSGDSNEEFWAVACGNYTFSPNTDDIAMLIRISKIASELQTPFISHASPDIFGLKSFGETGASENWSVSEDSNENKLWSVLRMTPEANYLSLVTPRVLSRLPYGEKTEPSEVFSFEEFTSIIQHSQYLWTNPIFVTLLILGQTFRQFGWHITKNLVNNITNLPTHIYFDGQENVTKSCAEIFMKHGNFEKMLTVGLIPVVSFKDSDNIKLGGLPSVAYPPSLLQGRWF